MEAKKVEFPKYASFNFPPTSPPREECIRKSKRRLTWYKHVFQRLSIVIAYRKVMVM